MQRRLRTDREELDIYRSITPPWLYFALWREFQRKHKTSPRAFVRKLHKAMEIK